MECRSFYFWKTKEWFFFQRKNWQQINNMSTAINSKWLQYGWWLFSSLGFFSIFKNAKSEEKKKERKKWSLKMRKKWRRWGVEDQIRDYGKKQFRWERSWRPELGSKKMRERVNGVQRRGNWLDRGLRRGKNLWFLAFQFMVVMPFTESGNFKGMNSWLGEQGVTFILDMQAVECQIWHCWLLFMSFWLCF